MDLPTCVETDQVQQVVPDVFMEQKVVLRFLVLLWGMQGLDSQFWERLILREGQCILQIVPILLVGLLALFACCYC